MQRIESYELPTLSLKRPEVERWEINPSNCVLLIHDMQRYFVTPFAEPLQDRLIGNIRRLRDWADAQEMRVIYTAQQGSMTREERGLQRDFWGNGMARVAANVTIVDPLAPRTCDWTVDKWRYSALIGNDLLGRLNAARIDQVIITGVYASVGILATALDLFGHDLQPFLVCDAMGDFDAVSHERTLDYAASYCARILTTAEITG